MDELVNFTTSYGPNIFRPVGLRITKYLGLNFLQKDELDEFFINSSLSVGRIDFFILFH